MREVIQVTERTKAKQMVLRGNMNKEKEEIAGDLEDEYLEKYESLSTALCDCCGARLTVEEFEEWESLCEECMWEETSGLIDDQIEEELE